MSTRVHLNRECMRFYKVLEYGPGRPSPEQKLRDVNLNFSGALLKKIQWNIDVSGKFGYFRYFFLRDDFFCIIYTKLYFCKYTVQITTAPRSRHLGNFPGVLFGSERRSSELERARASGEIRSSGLFVFEGVCGFSQHNFRPILRTSSQPTRRT
jgi:hypothetical protein